LVIFTKYIQIFCFDYFSGGNKPPLILARPEDGGGDNMDGEVKS